MTQKITVAALQLAFGDDTGENIRNVSELVREAADDGGQVVLPPELFEGPYFEHFGRGPRVGFTVWGNEIQRADFMRMMMAGDEAPKDEAVE